LSGTTSLAGLVIGGATSTERCGSGQTEEDDWTGTALMKPVMMGSAAVMI
jgi:hypothetical protein